MCLRNIGKYGQFRFLIKVTLTNEILGDLIIVLPEILISRKISFCFFCLLLYKTGSLPPQQIATMSAVKEINREDLAHAASVGDTCKMIARI